ncbi:MAG: right-handed parallel beta-helix repeat-containing protein [Planctomycetes bacterium]|nr:right-handed parallel beta-helix repeat-containing protein [Planctomycetota bacterium]
MRVVILFAFLIGACASEYTVAPWGNDAWSGTTAAPLRTIQVAVDRAWAGDRITVRGGTYREGIRFARAGTQSAPITLAAYAGEKPVVKGSLAVTGWQWHATGVWKRTQWTSASQQVFANGVMLKQIGSPPVGYGSWFYVPTGSGVADLVPGSFFCDSAAQTLYVRLADGSDPNQASIEASVRQRVLQVASSGWVQIKDLTFMHSNATAHAQIAPGVELSSNCLMERCDVQWMDGVGVSMGWQRGGSQLLECALTFNGMLGASADAHASFVMRGCTFAHNNQRGFKTGWCAGGVKITSDAWGTVEYCHAYGNRGIGIWFDTCRSGNPLVARSNRVYGNWDAAVGVMVEISSNASVYNNLVYHNDIRGIYVSASNGVRVHHNTIVGNRGYAALEVGGMPRSGYSLSDVSVGNNLICDNTGQYDTLMVKENGGDIVRLSCDSNLYWRGGGALALAWCADSRGGYVGTRASSIADWKARSPHDAGGLSALPGFTSSAYHLSATSPAINRAAWMSYVTADCDGSPRPAGGAYDIGAREVVSVVAKPTAPPATKFYAHINFQPTVSQVPAGYGFDDGSAFGQRANGMTYGWSYPIGELVERNATADQRYDTFIYTQNWGVNKNWEIAVPNGTYSVRVVLGDPSAFDSYYKMAIEGVLAVEGAPAANAPWRQGTSIVTVSDGRITLSNPVGARNNKLCFVDIDQQ